MHKASSEAIATLNKILTEIAEGAEAGTEVTGLTWNRAHRALDLVLGMSYTRAREQKKTLQKASESVSGAV